MELEIHTHDLFTAASASKSSFKADKASAKKKSSAPKKQSKTAISKDSGNLLYYGDNLEVMRRYLKDKSVDLIYLDPPFNSNQDYNVLFEEKDGNQSSAQIKAFGDTWRWDRSAAAAFEEVIRGGGKIAETMIAFRKMLGTNDLLAYLAMMAPRLAELRRILKPSGAIYLHCDPKAGHHLKLLLDAVFKPENFRNEIIWQRTSSHNDSKKWPHIHDIIFFYAGPKFKWNPVFLEHDPEYVKKFYRFEDNRGVYRLDHIIRSASMGPRPNLKYKYKNYTPEWGWRVVKEKLSALDKDKRIEWSSTGRPYLKRYLHEQKGTLASSVWTDIPPLSAKSAERLGYPTQKPEALLERILLASSDKGDVVFDPFCGCGTTVAVAQKLKRKWVGIDITHLAITLIKKRLFDTYGKNLNYKVIGEPIDFAGAKALSNQDKYQFQWWSLGLVNARPVEEKKGADRGIDGSRYFMDGKTQTIEQIIFSVKGGSFGVKDIRDLRGVIERENAAIGVLITLEEPTKPMRSEAADAGFYHAKFEHTKHPRLQILTIQDLFDGKSVDTPTFANIAGADLTFKRAPKAKEKFNDSEALDLEDEE